MSRKTYTVRLIERQPGEYRRGDMIEYYSSSKREWMDCRIERVTQVDGKTYLKVTQVNNGNRIQTIRADGGKRIRRKSLAA